MKTDGSRLVQQNSLISHVEEFELSTSIVDRSGTIDRSKQTKQSFMDGSSNHAVHMVRFRSR